MVCTSVNEGILSAVVALPREQRKDLTYAFYLLKDEEIIWRSKYSTDDRLFCKLELDGTYKVKAFVRASTWKKSFVSAPVPYKVPPKKAKCRNENAQSSYKEFVSESNGTIPGLPFTKLESPHQDYAILRFSESVYPRNEAQTVDLDRKINEFSSSVDLQYSNWNESSGQRIHVISGEKLSQDVPYLVSGMTRTESAFIFGQHDLTPSTLDAAVDQVGDCSIVRFDEDGFRVTTDYFGIGQVYYYAENGVICVSNRYHLLLLSLKAANIRLKINQNKAAGNLSALSQPFIQNFTREMDVADCFVLPAGKYMEICDGELALHDSGIAKVLVANEKFDDGQYRDLVHESRNEIIDNLAIVLKHHKFKQMRVDLTGGMDARMVFAALTNLDEYSDQIHIHTADMPGSPQDLQISLALTDRFDFKYDTIPRLTEETGLSDTFNEILSLDLGTYYGRKPAKAISRLTETIRINGFYGEICARPYYARSLSNQGYDGLTVRDFSDRYLSNLNDVLAPIGANAVFGQLLADELELLPGRSALEKFDYHYLFYRNGLHCSDRWLSRTLAPGWGPLQSKNMHRLKHSVFSESKGIRVQLDVTSALNPVASKIPYGREKDNKERRELSGVLLAESEFDDQVPTDLDDTRHRESAKIRGSRTKHVSKPHAQILQSDNSTFYASIRSDALDALRGIIQHGEVLDAAQGEKLYDFLVGRFKSDGEVLSDKTMVLINKLMSLNYQLELL